MKKRFFIIIALFAIIFSTSYRLDGQTNADWTILLLDVAGHTEVGGVEVYSKMIKCNNEDVVSLKFVNHNQHTVTVKWFDALLTQQRTWIKKDNFVDQKSLTIEPDKEIKGDCLDDNHIECLVKVKDFIVEPENFNEYAIYHFQVNAVMK